MEKNSKFLQFCNITVTVIMIIFTGYLFLISVFNTSMINFYEILEDYSLSEKTVYLTDSPLFHIAAISLIILAGYLIAPYFRIRSKETAKHILIAVHIVVFFVMLISIFVYNYEPIYDQYNVLKTTYNFINGHYYDWQKGGYNYMYPGLNSLILSFVPLVYVFGLDGSIIAIRIFNLGMFMLASYSFYGFCKETKLNSFITSVIFILYMPTALYIFFIYGNMASLSLSISAIWLAVLYLNHKKKKHAILCLAALIGSFLFKDSGIITFIAILIVLGIYTITSRNWRQLLWIPIFFIIYIGSNAAVNNIMETITGETVPRDADIYGHLYMGISENNRANGWYNDFTLGALIEYDFDFEQYQALSQTLYKQRVEILRNNPSYAVNFFAKKTASQWNNPTFQCIWTLQYMLLRNTLDNKECKPSSLLIDGSFSNMIFYYIYNMVQSIILFFSLCYFVFESGKAKLSSQIPAITFIGGFIFLFFWEAKAQYTLLFFILLFPYAATGFTALFKELFSLTGPDKRKQWYRSKIVIFLGFLLGIILLLSITDIQPINNTIKLGTDDDYYNDCLEQSVYYFSQFYNIDQP